MDRNKTYQDLEVWKQTKELVRDIYQLTKTFPKDEQFGLTNQLRRAAVSIPSNIAEDAVEITQKILFNFSLYQGEVFTKLRRK